MNKRTILLVVCMVATSLAEPPSPAQFGASGDGFGGHNGGLFSGYPGGRGFDGNEGSEPANYEFKYDVEDQENGVKFGHEENRQGEVAMGAYYVLLPDGRIQHVEYVADQDGYKPIITYEDSQAGYARGGPSGTENGFGSVSGHSQGGYQFKK